MVKQLKLLMRVVNKILGSKIVVCARAGGANTTPFFLAAHFAKQNTKFGGGESEGEAGIHFPHTPFSARLARASGFAARSAASFGILFKMSSDFFQQTPPKFIYRGISLARREAPSEATNQLWWTWADLNRRFYNANVASCHWTTGPSQILLSQNWNFQFTIFNFQ